MKLNNKPFEKMRALCSAMNMPGKIVVSTSGSYEEVLRKAKDTALQEMGEEAARLGANAVIGIDLDYETVGASGSMLMVTCSGTAVSME